MNAKARFLCIMLVFLSASLSVFGKNSTPMDAFIHRMKTTNTFVPVSNLWVPDRNFDKTELLKYVEDAQPLTIDYGNIAAFMQQKNTAISLVLPAADGSTYTG